MKGRVVGGIAALITIGLVWVVAQNASGVNSLSAIFPGGALVYVESRNLSGILRDWDTSPEKKLWLASDNYQSFSRTRLFMRLGDAQSEFAEAAGFAPDMSLVNSVAGSQSAIAIYDIGELEFLYITRMPAARVLASTPFAQRTAYERRESAGITYYVRSGANRRVAAFGAADGLLFLATRGDLVANALALHAKRQPVTPLAQDRWFGQLTQVAGNAGEIRIALNMPALIKSNHFRSYWVQRNSGLLRSYSAGSIDLFRESGQVREERILIPESQTAAPSEQAVARVMVWAPADVGLIKAWANPKVDEILDRIRAKMFPTGMDGEQPTTSTPSAANPDAIAGDASDLETRIDQSPLEIGAQNLLAPLLPVIEAADVQAMLQIQTSKPSSAGVFIGNETAIGLLAANDWPPIDVSGIALHRQGKTLILASNTDLLQRVVARLNTSPTGPGATYTARYLHARELEPFTRMMTQIDANIPGGEEGPRFFSQNVASLGRVLNRIDSMSITVHDDGSQVKQQMVYKLKP